TERAAPHEKLARELLSSAALQRGRHNASGGGSGTAAAATWPQPIRFERGSKIDPCPTSRFRRRCWLVFERVLDPSAAMRQRALAPAQEPPKQSCRVASLVDGDAVCGRPLGRHEREVGDRHPRDPPTDQ